MGRPQLHKTEEAWLKAACRSNRKYYEKNKKEIGLKMTMNYHCKRYNAKSKHRDLASTFTAPKPNLSSLTPPSPPAHKNSVIYTLHRYDIKDAQSNLVVISAEIKPLCIKMVQDFQDNREAIQAHLSQHLETLERIQGFLCLATLDNNPHPNASDSVHVAVAGVMCQSKAITMATEELWCYSATREIDEEMTSKFLCGGLLYQTIVLSFEDELLQWEKQDTIPLLISSKNMMPTSKPQPMSIKKQAKPLWEVQDEFLQVFSPEYFRLQDDKDHIIFFNNLYAHFFARWPEEQRLFPGIT
ncbi:uncharacterized protein F5147DRAFT_773603 [Suillus discolor]|uniref:Uncharacterized protein n=1 Tax=Suillus discolor TaxID=1912936 RepID=A0A9P7JU60_9AGAM|nr:uncharacterized protein F5147DRAFT_773603 [Suillus discolor]KAG2108396.1 hypothetical protein F5147DRAFT_773603 [Suillus discolor]